MKKILPCLLGAAMLLPFPFASCNNTPKQAVNADSTGVVTDADSFVTLSDSVVLRSTTKGEPWNRYLYSSNRIKAVWPERLKGMADLEPLHDELLERIFGDDLATEADGDVNKAIKLALAKSIFSEDGELKFEPVKEIPEDERGTNCGEYIVEVENVPNDDFRTFKITKYTYAGGAHGSTTEDYVVFNPRTGEVLDLEDALNGKENFPAYLKAVNEAIPQYNKKNGTQLTAAEELPDVFYFEGNNIVFVFQQYEIGPYSNGIPHISVSLE